MKINWLIIKIFLLFSIYGNSATDPTRSWTSIEVERFNIYFPDEMNQFANHIAKILPSIDKQVIKLVGYNKKGTIDIIIDDQNPVSNGFTLLADPPRIIINPFHPDPESNIGTYKDWIHRLTVHELIHVHHMIHDPKVLVVPRWIAEGYAVLLEGKASWGRPDDPLINSQIMGWAAAGKLPEMINMDNPQQIYDLDMIYHLGYGFMRYLEDQYGEHLLPFIWRKMEDQGLTWKQAFYEGTGKTALDLFDEFKNDLIIKSSEINKQLEPWRKTAKLWQQFDQGITKIRISPDETKIATSSLVNLTWCNIEVYELNDNQKAIKNWTDKEQNRLKKTESKFVKKKPKSFPRNPISRLSCDNNNNFEGLDWVDNNWIVFTKNRRESLKKYDPVLSEPFLWHPQKQLFKPIALGSRYMDIAGKSSASYRSDENYMGGQLATISKEKGTSRIKLLDLNGKSKNLTKLNIKTQYGALRFHPKKNLLGFLEHNNGWKIKTIDLSTGKDESILLDQNFANINSFTWSSNGKEIFFTTGEKGISGLYKLTLASKKVSLVFQSLGILTSPEATGNSVYVLEMQQKHSRIWKIDPKQFKNNQRKKPKTISALYNKPLKKQKPQDIKSPIKQSNYGLGAQFYQANFGFGKYPSWSYGEIGLHGGDLIGRWHWQGMIGNLGNRAIVKLSFWNWEPYYEGFSFFYQPSLQRNAFTRPDKTWDIEGSGKGGGISRTWGSGNLLLTFDWSQRSFLYETPDGTIENQKQIYVKTIYRPSFLLLNHQIGFDWRQVKDEEKWNRTVYSWSYKPTYLHSGPSFSYSQGRITGNIPQHQNFQLGGNWSAVRTKNHLSQQIASPLLPLTHLTGTAFNRYQAEISANQFGSLFWDRVQIGQVNQPEDQWQEIEVRGYRYEWKVNPPWQPEKQGLHLTAGFGSVLKQTLGWVSVINEF